MNETNEYYQDKVAVVTGGASGIGLVLGDEGDSSGARSCFNPDNTKFADDYLLDVARKRRRGEWVV